jgi:hypothetical protein
MYSQAASPIAPPLAPSQVAPIAPLDAEHFEHLTENEAESLLSSRFRGFLERGWDWKDALMLAVRPDAPAAFVPRSGDVSRP